LRHQVEPDLSRFASLLLAAGRGTRLRPLTGSIPKPALPLLDIPLGGFALTDLALLGGPLFVNLSSMSELVERALSPFGTHITFVTEEPEPFGTAGTLSSLKERFDGPVVTRNADMLCDVPMPAVIDTHLNAGASATIVTAPVDSHADLIVDGDRAVRLIDRRREDRPGELWLGVAVWERDVVERIGPQRPLDLASGLLVGLVDSGEVAIHSHAGYSLDVGTLERYLAASVDLLYGRAVLSLEPPGSVIDVDEGLAYVGPDAIVDRGSLGPGAIISAGAHIPNDVRVERSVVWPNERVTSGAQLSDGVWALGEFLKG
jgi:mannose-1-phosphate guanylyltransferase